MKIIKEYQKNHDGYYLIRIRCEAGDRTLSYIFKDLSGFCEEDSVYIDIHKLNNPKFYEESNIKYYEEESNFKLTNLIPIGLVDFIDKRNYANDILKISCREKDDLYKVNYIIKNVEQAIKIKYEAINFLEKVEKGQEITAID